MEKDKTTSTNFPEYPKDILRTSDFDKLKAANEKLSSENKVLREALSEVSNSLRMAMKDVSAYWGKYKAIESLEKSDKAINPTTKD